MPTTTTSAPKKLKTVAQASKEYPRISKAKLKTARNGLEARAKARKLKKKK